MKVYHQTGHRFGWNIDSFIDDKTGSGLIFSPVNIDSKKLLNIPNEIKKVSFFDPQLYLPKESKGKLHTYNYFPTNIKNDFQTSDFDTIKYEIAQQCIDFQVENNFRYIVIPSRYYDTIPTDYDKKIVRYFLEPFLKYYLSSNINKEILLTLIVSQSQIINDDYRNDLLNWLTGIQGINGVYLIFKNNFQTKLIKDSNYLFKVLVFIDALKRNDFLVHIGYTDIEAILYSIANPDSVSMGSYDNLRRFGVKRFTQTEGKPQRPPNPRLYSRQLFQFIEYGWVGAIKNLFSDWKLIFEDSKYHPLMFKPDYNWHFSKPETYKHFFLVFSSQASKLSVYKNDRVDYLKDEFKNSLRIFKELEKAGIPLDDRNDGSHLNIWIATLNMFKKYTEENK
jgi:hypothetical protein